MKTSRMNAFPMGRRPSRLARSPGELPLGDGGAWQEKSNSKKKTCNKHKKDMHPFKRMQDVRQLSAYGHTISLFVRVRRMASALTSCITFASFSRISFGVWRPIIRFAEFSVSLSLFTSCITFGEHFSPAFSFPSTFLYLSICNCMKREHPPQGASGLGLIITYLLINCVLFVFKIKTIK